VSPKARAPLRQREGNELKLVFPQEGFDDGAIEALEKLAFENFLLQPMDGPELERNTDAATEYCSRNPRWRLSLQSHKLMGIR
jgi:7-carboxy-7-deazaguanine synthase